MLIKTVTINSRIDFSFAKFPRRDDEFNIVIWEVIILVLAKMLGLMFQHCVWKISWIKQY